MTRLCHSDTIPEGAARGLQLGDYVLIAVKKNGTLRLYLNRCPHRGIGLEWFPDRFMDPTGELLQCATHGAQFLPESGLCISGPCSGDSLQPVPFTLVDGHIEVEEDDLSGTLHR